MKHLEVAASETGRTEFADIIHTFNATPKEGFFALSAKLIRRSRDLRNVAC